jgi:hypothetical protein
LQRSSEAGKKPERVNIIIVAFCVHTHVHLSLDIATEQLRAVFYDEKAAVKQVPRSQQTRLWVRAAGAGRE